MGEMITETLLEMYFFPALIEYFSNLHGARFLKLYKPSCQNEAWVAFDQGWHHSTLSNQEFFIKLRDAINSDKTFIDNFYLGYFLQFKKVEIITRRKKYYPEHYEAPFYRAELSLRPNPTTGVSQHETLLKIQQIKNTTVSYACPMLFNVDDIYEPPDINKLRMMPISTSPKSWKQYERHFICFQTPDDNFPVWHSESIRGKSFSFKDWASGDFGPQKLDGKEIFKLIEKTLEGFPIKTGVNYFYKEDKRFIKFLPESMTIIEFKRR